MNSKIVWISNHNLVTEGSLLITYVLLAQPTFYGKFGDKKDHLERNIKTEGAGEAF